MQDNLLNPENVATDPRSKKTNIMRKTGHWKADFESELQEEIAKVDPINICWRIRKKIAEKLRAEKYPDSPQLKKLKFSKESFQTKRTQDIEPCPIRVFAHLQKATVALCLQESGTVRLTVLVSKSFQKTYLRRFVRDQKIQDRNKKWRLLEFSTDEDASPICIRRYAYQPTQQEMETEESEPEKKKKVTRTRKASKSDPVVKENFSDDEYE